MMKYGVILAGGIGKRMNSSLPKQFIELDGIPIIIRSIRKLLEITEFDFIYIAIHPDWLEYLKKLLDLYQIEKTKIQITLGGNERIDTIENVVNTIINFHPLNESDVIVIHEAVRPFVSHEILRNSIIYAQKYGAVVAASPVTDTMLWVEEDDLVVSMPNRSKLYHGQAPDSFRLKLLKESLEKISSEERKNITGTAQICMICGIPIHIIPGDPKNIKITTESDLDIANSIIKREI